ncbi:hypothetical protein A3A14_00940 [Candidatus Daviesbacteria bacterium RIFCSPLOWO2_01_FULL_43_38]|uniref:Uncharacterized protein n=2 Tax=Candidatus Daviesiibacteriota TaxID=1752718 RepID=A0A1F5K6A1_9BACT|nr:MAG: hypothetical protein UV41_C0003G0007 [Candidatus Daviesbacteria bacterium GW2011_GWA2_42_7]OGE36486.1 MAG: hypothetical protein A3E45_01020 [Candidatus Daviesbacteria bacterium RIFCSPHIGHO2_12_FULL_43_11]OGE63531.1 MAG: hypothetical protein A3A14_00940 [Candidatus Daviesbacteria bacterium RIFCSPLOWO2_01_FULL_43_38]
MKKRTIFLIIALLIFGIFYKLHWTSGGNFIFNMDNARDMVDVREMVVLDKLRLIGPTSGVEGFFNGPGWYYLLAIPFILSKGNPYGAVVLMIVLWAIGGFFLMKLLSRYGVWVVLLGGVVWISSNYVMLATLYSYNPNPVVLLAPLFIYLLEKYINTNSLLYGVEAWILGGLFFNFEMAFGIFIPAIFFAAIIISGKKHLFYGRYFWVGFTFFVILLLPQILFELRHDFFMTKSVMNYLNKGVSSGSSILSRFDTAKNTYLGALSGTMMNWEFLSRLTVIAWILIILKFFRDRKFGKDTLLIIVMLFLIIPPLFHILLPIKVMSWHLGGTMAAAIIFIAALLGRLGNLGSLGKLISIVLSVVVVAYAVNNLEIHKNMFGKKVSLDASVFMNEISAVDYVYREAQGKNFRVYVYLPSVIDYPYQYLFWWYGQKEYGFFPKDYAYLPDKPEYIRDKEKLGGGKSPEDSGLTFLIKQPDTIGQRHLWENSFSHLPLLNSVSVGPLIIETRQQIP